MRYRWHLRRGSGLQRKMAQVYGIACRDPGRIETAQRPNRKTRPRWSREDSRKNRPASNPLKSPGGHAQDLALLSRREQLFAKDFETSHASLLITIQPPWPNGQGVGPLIRRLRARVPQGVCRLCELCTLPSSLVRPPAGRIVEQRLGQSWTAPSGDKPKHW